jgi:hypothetical protein
MSRRSDYEFLTEWTVEGDIVEVAAVLKDVEAFPNWWRPIYRAAKIVDPGDPDGTGRIVEFTTRGFLPYVLRWSIEVVESREPHGFTFRASGDLAGMGVWALRQDGKYVKVHMDWRVRAEKTVIRVSSFALRSVFSRNHLWAMAKGEEGLQAELRRRHGETEAAQS